MDVIFQAEAVAPEAQIHLHVDDVPVSNDEDNQKSEIKITKDDDVNIDELNESLQDLIIEYRIHEQQKNSEVNQENENDDNDDDDDNDDANLQRILKQIGVSLHNKYRQKGTTDQSSTKLSDMIQQLYKTLKKTQPQLFTKSSRTDKTSIDDQQSTTTDTNSNEEVHEDENDDDDDDDDDEEIIPLTPEMEHANTLYHQANKLINISLNQQYET